MRTRYDLAAKLRLQGKSYNEISAELKISKSTLSAWFKDMDLPAKALERLTSRRSQGVMNGLVQRNKEQTRIAQNRAQETRNSSKKEIGKLSPYELKLIGTALYWAEGYKRPRIKDGIERTGHTISFVNADPEMVKVFMQFLAKSLSIPIDKIRAYMRLYPGMSEGECKSYWRGVTGLPKEQFFKTTWLISKASLGKRPANRLPHGTLQIEVCSTSDFHRIMGWIEGMKGAT